MQSQIDPIDVMLCLVGGMSMKEASINMGFSHSRVRTVMLSVRRGLNARSNEQAIVRAFAMGYLTIASGTVSATGKPLVVFLY